MKYSKLFGKTVREAPSDAQSISHKLLYQGGFIRESSSGRYFFLPLGIKVMQKIMEVIREEMDKTGAQELLTPVMHPLELWLETNRNKSTGYELTIVKDRRGAQFALGGTAEEMMVDLVRKFQITYKDLPFNIYQFSQKFRDELRARGGLLRVREFMMKDAYSFHATEDDFKKEYKKMMDTYSKVFKRLGLETVIVESDNGYIGGDYCHEFVVESEVGESKYLVNSDGSYAAHQDIAVFEKEKKNTGEELKSIKTVEAKRGTTMEDGVALHNLPLWQQIKDVLYVDESGRFILAVIRGDYDVNEIKLRRVAGVLNLRMATDQEIRSDLHSEPGFISPVALKEKIEAGKKILIVADDSLLEVRNMYGGANAKFKDLININYGRDFSADVEADITLCKEGYKGRNGKTLIEKKGIEVGNIFQLGYYYSNKMKNAVFVNKKGKGEKYYMGCYGIGLGRTFAAIVEKHHDDKGIIWPPDVSPFKAHLIMIGNEKVKNQADKIYAALTSNKIAVLYDDRESARAGEKFTDFDLIGIPVRLVVSEKTGDKIEVKKRNETKTNLVPEIELLNFFL